MYVEVFGFQIACFLTYVGPNTYIAIRHNGFSVLFKKQFEGFPSIVTCGLTLQIPAYHVDNILLRIVLNKAYTV